MSGLDDGRPLTSITIVCTDRNTHNPRTLSVLRLREDGQLEEKRNRVGQVPHRPDGARPGPNGEPIRVTYARRGILPANVNREEHNGRAKWRFTCPTCHEWPPIGGERMRQLYDAAVAEGLRRVDVSRLI